MTAGSRFGLKGTEDLGNGLKIGFVLENGFSSDTGSFTQDNRLFGREAQLNLSGAFGTVAFGRMGSLASGNGTFGLLGSMSPFGTSWGQYASEAGHRKVLNDVVENGRTPPDLPPMSAIWVNTGGPIPKGVTAIIPSAARSDLADAQKAAEPENGIMRRGAEWCVGDLLLKSGVRIGAAETALLFEAGMDVVKARSLASVGIIATGSELRDFVCRAEGPTRVSSDAAYLRSLLLDAGIRDVWARSAADDSEAIAAALTGLAVRSDVLITIGGTGRGSKDLTRRAILEAGGKLLDSQEADRCSGGASPFIAGELDGRPVIGLPGNPLAAMMIAQRVVLPLIAARSGIALHEKVVRAAFSGNIPAGKTGELCVSLCGCGGTRIARAVQKGTGSVLLLRDAAGVVKVGKDGIKEGDEVDVICFIN